MRDWRALREALDVTQQELAEALFCSPREIQRLEAELRRHRCPIPAIRAHLRYLLREPSVRDRLAQAGYTHPFSEDLT